jgi:sialate O-acetylesterase
MADATQQSRAKHPPMEENGKKQRKSASDGRHDTSGNYNAMVNPLTPLRIKGILWYQGGNNTSNGEIKIYRRALPAVFKAWRTAWGEGDFPIIMGQQSLFAGNEGKEGNYPILRNVQRLTAQEQPAIGMVITIDLNKNAHDVHDINKPDMGLRMANAARAVAYHENVEYTGPLFDHATVNDAKMQVYFTHAASGLMVKNGSLAGFEISGADKAYVPADAAIDGNTVVVSSPKVAGPMYVRYAWSSAPVATLYSKDDLPASPFTSEPQ